jgi:hypothetical protein
MDDGMVVFGNGEASAIGRGNEGSGLSGRLRDVSATGINSLFPRMVDVGGEGFAWLFRAAVNRPRYVDVAPLGLRHAVATAITRRVETRSANIGMLSRWPAFFQYSSAGLLS